MESQSSDDEDDRQHLIEQNERRNNGTKSPRHHQTTFQIDDDFKSRSPIAARRLNFSLNMRYLLAIVLPLFIVILYFTTDIRNMFQYSLSNVKYDASTNHMRESELRALYLLKQQQLGLLKLWNHNSGNNSTFTAAVNSSVNSVSSVSDNAKLENLKSDLLSQISLNKQIQQVLLSSHRLEDSLDSLLDNFTDPTTGGFNMCKKVDRKLSERKTIEWKPKSNKYLFAICVSGQMSNHLICLEKHMFFAAILNRVLVFPSSKVDYAFHKVLDIIHINQCLGRKVVVTFEEFAENKKNHLHIDKFICYFSSPQPCYVDDDHVKKLKSLGLSMSKPESVWTEDVKKPNKRTVQEVLSKFSSDDDVIAIGDVFFADVEKDWVLQPGGPIAHKCKTLIEPSRLIMITAQRFVQTFLGKDFIALHFRRHGFLKFWYVFFSLPNFYET